MAGGVLRGKKAVGSPALPFPLGKVTVPSGNGAQAVHCGGRPWPPFLPMAGRHSEGTGPQCVKEDNVTGGTHVGGATGLIPGEGSRHHHARKANQAGPMQEAWGPAFGCPMRSRRGGGGLGCYAWAEGAGEASDFFILPKTDLRPKMAPTVTTRRIMDRTGR